ncbi:unnamed protein product [Moneuplotes crassus]|uniref:Uncharacterized protein n=1 Tax=Euplotes crassus TaxID=5936 RepID=A0AAD1XBY3_EUPCR|nr:unnamed protein product [Moneuplotes crassus]
MDVFGSNMSRSGRRMIQSNNMFYKEIEQMGTMMSKTPRRHVRVASPQYNDHSPLLAQFNEGLYKNEHTSHLKRFSFKVSKKLKNNQRKILRKKREKERIRTREQKRQVMSPLPQVPPVGHYKPSYIQIESGDKSNLKFQPLNQSNSGRFFLHEFCVKSNSRGRSQSQGKWKRILKKIKGQGHAVIEESVKTSSFKKRLERLKKSPRTTLKIKKKALKEKKNDSEAEGDSEEIQNPAKVVKKIKRSKSPSLQCGVFIEFKKQLPRKDILDGFPMPFDSCYKSVASLITSKSRK